MPAATPHPAPDPSSPAGRPAQAAGPPFRPEQSAAPPDDACALLANPFLGGARSAPPCLARAEQSEILDWEWAALSHEEDPWLTYSDEDEPGDYEEWLDEVSCVLAAPSVPAAAQDFAVGGSADAKTPGPELAGLADQVWKQDLTSLDDDQLTGVLQAANRLAAWSASVRVAAVSGLAARREAAGRESGDWRPFDHIDDEVAVALTLTRRSAGPAAWTWPSAWTGCR